MVFSVSASVAIMSDHPTPKPRVPRHKPSVQHINVSNLEILRSKPVRERELERDRERPLTFTRLITVICWHIYCPPFPPSLPPSIPPFLPPSIPPFLPPFLPFLARQWSLWRSVSREVEQQGCCCENVLSETNQHI